MVEIREREEQTPGQRSALEVLVERRRQIMDWLCRYLNERGEDSDAELTEPLKKVMEEWDLIERAEDIIRKKILPLDAGTDFSV